MSTFCLTFHLDSLSLWTGTFGLASPSSDSRVHFGATVATPRILRMLQRLDIRSTWFVSGIDAEREPDRVRELLDAGHEIAYHGWAHEDVTGLSEREERDLLERGLTTLEKVTGQRAVGYRSPCYDHSTQTVPLLLEFGLEWDSTLMGRDFTPYHARIGDAITDQGFAFGTPSALVEVPISWSLNDLPYLEIVMAPPMMLPGSADTTALAQRWRDDFDFCAGLPAGHFTPVFHPQSIGRASKITLLRELLDHARSAGTTFSTVTDASRSWSSGHLDDVRPQDYLAPETTR